MRGVHRARWVSWQAAAQRSAGRQRAHAARAARALRRAGPGHLPGLILEVEASDDGIRISGWAGLPGNGPVAVLVTLDEQMTAAAHLEGGSNDRTWPWTILLGWPLVPQGEVRVGALVIFADGLTETLAPLTVALVAPKVGPGALDLAPEATLQAPMTWISGWFRPDAGFDRVEVRLGDGALLRARTMSVPRPDLAQLLEESAAPLAGWDLALPVPELDAPTELLLEVHLVGPAGRVPLASAPVSVAAVTRRHVIEPDRLTALRARVDEVIDQRAHRRQPEADRVHLVVATHDLGLGGGQLYLQLLLHHLLRREDLVCTVLTMADGPLRDELELAGARVHIVGPWPTEGLAYETRMSEVAGLIADDPPSCVIANTGGSFWGIDLAARFSAPGIWAIHESFPIEQFFKIGLGGIDEHVRARYYAAALDAAALVFEADATSHLYEHVARPGRCIRVDYGIDLDRIDAAIAAEDRETTRARLGIRPGTTLLLCLGTMEPRKAQGALVQAFGRLTTRHPTAVLALVGDRPGAYSDAVHAVVHRTGVGDRIRIEPVTPDIDAWYRAADGFALASDVESLPRSMLEAMAFGVPVLGSAVFGVPELINDGSTGFLFRHGCLGDLSAAIDRFLSLTEAERRTVGRAGNDLVRATRAGNFYGEAYSALIDAFMADPGVLPASVLTP